MRVLVRFFLLVACVGVVLPASAADKRLTPSVSCTPKATSIKGTWQCYRTPSVGDSSNETYTFAQSGSKFSSSDDDTSYRIFGTIDGSFVNISRVVNGEELEGYVLFAQGHIISVGDGSNNGIITTYHDSQAGVGSFNCFKQAS